MVGSGMLNGLNGVFYMAIIGFVLSFLGIIYGIYLLISTQYKDEVITSSHKIIPELKLTITENKVDTLYIYKLEK